MQPMKIFLQVPWKNTDSPYYKYLRAQPPEDIKYINAQDFNFIQKKNKLKFNNLIKQIIKKLIKIFYPSMPNAHYTPNSKNYDLIHCAHCLSKNKQPWICDIEFVGQFWASGPWENFPSKKRVLKYLKSPYCKKILAWTEWSKKGILKELPEIKDKVEVLYPPIPKQKKIKSSSRKINLLFIGRDFEIKGGQIALEVFDKLTKKYKNVHAIMISNIPKNFLEKYKNNKKIKFYDSLISHKKVSEEIYPNADIFLYPTFSDTFGFAILESQSFGLPIIATKTLSTHTLQETIDEGKTGFIIQNLSADAINRVFQPKIIEQIIEKAELIITNKKLLKNMSKNCVEKFNVGKFSIKKRNKRLRNIYLNAIKENKLS